MRSRGGRETWFSLTKDYCFKEILLYEGCRTSLQYHKEKEETNLIVSGTGMLVTETPVAKVYGSCVVQKGDIYHFKPGEIHRFEAINGDLVMHEASSCQIDDVIRLEDSYRKRRWNKALK